MPIILVDLIRDGSGFDLKPSDDMVLKFLFRENGFRDMVFEITIRVQLISGIDSIV